MKNKIFGINVDNLSKQETIDKIVKLIRGNEPVQHIVVNANKINMMLKDDHLKQIISSSPLVNADGASILLAGKLLNRPFKERVTGIDLFYSLLKICEEEGFRPYFFGADEIIINELVKKVKIEYPNLEIAGYRNGYFSDDESYQIAVEINNSKADVLFVGFSSPKKEFWINKYREVMNVPFSMGVGGTFDVYTGKTTRAPMWMQKVGLEWFHRLVLEPRRMFKRYLVGNSEFIYNLAKEKIEK